MPNTYSRAWREYRRLEILSISPMVAFIVVPLGVVWLTNEGYWRDLTVGILLVVLLKVMAIFGI